MPITREEFSRVFPLLKSWIENTLGQNAAGARSVGSVGFARLPKYYRDQTLSSAHVISVARLPMPPVSAWGFERFAEWANSEFGGVTYLNTFFVTTEYVGDESLYFHELIHVVQWQLLGLDSFVALYAEGLDRFGYRNSPLEVMAYSAQERFDRGEIFDAEALVVTQLQQMLRR